MTHDRHAASPDRPAPRARRPRRPLEARDITAWFGSHKVLDRVSLTMPAGGITALIGPSGCGKSTFLRILNRMHELVPSAALAGEVLLDGEDIYDPQRKLIDARRAIGMVFQKPNPFPAMSIRENVARRPPAHRHPGSARPTRTALVEACLVKAGLWNEVKDRLDAPGGGLSGGQQQRLCIARSLAIKPRVLLMDEPCSALDPTSTRVIEETMKDLAQRGHDRHRHPQHAAGRAGLRHVRVLPGLAGHPRRHRRARRHRGDVHQPAGPAHRPTTSTAASAEHCRGRERGSLAGL